jgi:dUTP pyrophosphatase
VVEVKIKVLPGANIPNYASVGAAGADIYACLDNDMVIQPRQTLLVPTGIAIEIPEGFEAQIRPRSGLAINHGITLLNSPGTIDSDYRGEIKIIITNLGEKEFVLTQGMRIAQMVFSKVYKGSFSIVDELDSTIRNDGGFGHSGLR